jgi:exodeoxyribonuclease V alpha subunit
VLPFLDNPRDLNVARRAMPAAEETVEVVVDELRYRSDDGRFTVLLATRADGKGSLIVVGDLGGVAPGESIRVRGRLENHSQYGERFRAIAYLPVFPSTAKGLARYLGSGIVPGVGPQIAERIVKKFGARTLEVITHESVRLREVEGVGKKRAEKIAAAVRTRRAEAEAISFVHSVGLGPGLGRRVYAEFGPRTVSVLREDPYLVAELVPGIGFLTADRIGERAGIARDDPRRAVGAATHLIARAADEGHVFLPMDALAKAGAELDVPAEAIEQAVETLAGRGVLTIDRGAVYAPPLHAAENAVAKSLRRLARPRGRDPERSRALAKSVAPESLTETQLEAVVHSLTHGLSVLTGGPGTGKTTTIRAIVAAQVRAERRVVLCAPTGRAAKRMSEATKHPASTIHRLLEWTPGVGRFERNEHHPIDAELVLVDEASMLDLRLAQSLLSAVAPSSHLVLVGDVDQLPPVGAGQVLRELILSGIAPIVRLTQIFRQAQESAIVRGAYAILEGRIPESSPPKTYGAGELFLVRRRDPDEIAEQLVRAHARIAEVYGLDRKNEIQVLTPMRKGPLGTERLNVLLQRVLNPGPEREGALRAGDRVMQLRNDYEKDVFNGDTGEVRRVEGGIAFVSMDGRDVQYPPEELDALALAYASTVHKVQGSEFPAVVVVLSAGHHVLLTRALLYTAVTRAKRVVAIVGDDRALARAVQNAESYRSYSRLAERLRAGDD